ncbi:MAG: hypothetical protein A2Z99_13380 [Treponema sp. GWB1_62_6]|nr:MAG: hypothetical protein A2Y36_18630 [Treponema sp. GWA1_62_8]OHE67625.1 MAG: hypothetical protein A2001_19750 [Treponema sp. GWC1_61_84]OHE70002.1 MAG: hypothetical protein A2Z99_13380 [Treponema sp. GWB1_62_6]OHE77148.1 MAG: hypothetical protein A2413_16110 [Treponema sp. RIFOXYC1_FULL_61_9]
MRNLICYFSATGNTSRAVALIVKELEKAGQKVESLRIAPGVQAPRDLGSFDRLIIAFPTLAWNPPVMVKRFLRRLPSGKRPAGGLRAAVIAVDGGGCGPAPAAAARILARRGFDVGLTARAGYAENWVQVGLGPKSGEEAELKAEKGDEMALAFAEKLIDLRRERYEVSVPFAFLGNGLAFLFGIFGRRFLGKLYFADSDCTGCGLCEKTCPVGTITMGKGKDSRPSWKLTCEDCGRCINVCPKRAINVSILYGAVQLTLIVSLATTGIGAFNAFVRPDLAAILAPAIGAASFIAIDIVILILAHAVCIGPLDWTVFRWIRGIPGINRAFTLTYSKGFYRYIAKGFVPKK